MNKSNLQTGIWLIGIGIIAITNFWWPGIMFVVGVSVLMSGSPRAAVWVFGIGVLALLDFWWPGILFLIGIGLLVGAIFPDREERPSEASPEFAPIPDAPSIENTQDAYAPPQPVSPTPAPDPTRARLWLPTRCPACGAPLTPTEVIWHDDTHAECSYCHTPLSPK
jgi:hypothetical protein